MREFRSSGSVRGVLSNGHPYRDTVPSNALRRTEANTAIGIGFPERTAWQLCCSATSGKVKISTLLGPSTGGVEREALTRSGPSWTEFPSRKPTFTRTTSPDPNRFLLGRFGGS